LRTQQIVGFESGVTDTVDPLAGSFFVETLTDEVEKNAQALINKIDAMGGSVSAIEQGFIQDEIARSAYEYQRQIENGEKTIVGVNKFVLDKEVAVPGFRIDDSIRQVQADKLAALRARRSQNAADRCLQAIEKAAIDGSNLMPFVIEAVECWCTLGEISDVLRKVFGEYK